ncbi:protein translocase subunit SecF [Marinospirillum alkaliphilum]|uniref:Protein-export membrane protein SecF n=1 Tax=Marinospirillum alkaliphilum DSM 21637 TaxID=1122209 RepID=A0A1K1VXV4_9GAMM|nr:protein translocase subunit SecF [Marinospirillum alkaliphilum]SFX29952.1 protein translocase subunit secF [Marinospirillum alkaliphilum DSM 21637]
MPSAIAKKLLNIDIDFMRLRKLAFGLSAALILISLASLAIQGLRLGLDFTGGTLVELEYAQSPELEDIRAKLERAGYEQFVVQNFGSSRDVLVRLNQGFSPDVGEQVRTLLASGDIQVQLKRAEFVGAQVGEELRDQGGLGMLVALICVMIYVAFRFQYKFALGSVLALAHDVIILLGFFSLFRIDFDLTVLAALLAVVGYSLNDTIVVYDRIRENFRTVREGGPKQLINLAINQTLLRTVITSFTTLLVLFALLFFGGEMIHNFALALIIGLLVGTYSSIFVAGTFLLVMKVDRDDLAIPVKEGVLEEDGRP